MRDGTLLAVRRRAFNNDVGTPLPTPRPPPRPVLPAFQGNLPMGMHELFPKANISRVGSSWRNNPLRDHFSGEAWVDALDPLFATIADKFMTGDDPSKFHGVIQPV